MKWALILLAALASPTLAERSFTIGGETFSEVEILDARALPDMSGQAAVMITFSESGTIKLQRVTTQLLNQPAPMVLDGRELMAPVVREPLLGGVVQITGSFALAEAEALAKSISGKDPLPDSLED